MMEPPKVSADVLRAMLSFIARDLGIVDDKVRNPVTLTREIRAKISEYAAIVDIAQGVYR